MKYRTGATKVKSEIHLEIQGATTSAVTTRSPASRASTLIYRTKWILRITINSQVSSLMI